MSTEKDLEGPYIRWVNYGYEGWKPESFPDLAKALTTPCFHDFELTKKIYFEIRDGGEVVVKV